MHINIKKNKKKDNIRKILLIDSSDLIKIGRSQNYLEKHHINKIYEIYKRHKNLENYSKIISIDEIENNNFNLNIPNYIDKKIHDDVNTVQESKRILKKSMEHTFKLETNLKLLIDKL